MLPVQYQFQGHIRMIPALDVFLEDGSKAMLLGERTQPGQGAQADKQGVHLLNEARPQQLSRIPK